GPPRRERTRARRQPQESRTRDPSAARHPAAPARRPEHAGRHPHAVGNSGAENARRFLGSSRDYPLLGGGRVGRATNAATGSVISSASHSNVTPMSDTARPLGRNAFGRTHDTTPAASSPSPERRKPSLTRSPRLT